MLNKNKTEDILQNIKALKFVPEGQGSTGNWGESETKAFLELYIEK